MQWLFFTNAGVGPVQGSAHHFLPEQFPRYQNETRRLYGVLDRRLVEQAAVAASGDGPWLVGGKMTIADLANWT